LHICCSKNQVVTFIHRPLAPLAQGAENAERAEIKKPQAYGVSAKKANVFLLPSAQRQKKIYFPLRAQRLCGEINSHAKTVFGQE
jgi:hypothetical protein